MDIQGSVTLPAEPIVTAVMQSPEMAELVARITALEGGEPPPPIDPPPPVEPPPPVPPGELIKLGGVEQYLHGVNVAWWEFTKDVGYYDPGWLARNVLKSDGSLNADATVVKRFAPLQAANVNLVTWWVFPNDPGKHPNGPKQFIRNSAGKITGLTPSTYQDIGAMVKIAEHFDFYLHLAVFSQPHYYPDGWFANPDVLAALRPLFAHYKDDPRVAVWSPLVEPGWSVWNNKVNGDWETLQAFVSDFATAVHEEAPAALVTLNSAMLDELPRWVGMGLDYYSSSWYDYMEGGNWDALATNYPEVQARYSLDKPLIIGEFFAGATAEYPLGTPNPLGRLQAWKDKGYAGAVAWSLFAEKTSTPMPIDWPSMEAFGATL